MVIFWLTCPSSQQRVTHKWRRWLFKHVTTLLQLKQITVKISFSRKYSGQKIAHHLNLDSNWKSMIATLFRTIETKVLVFLDQVWMMCNFWATVLWTTLRMLSVHFTLCVITIPAVFCPLPPKKTKTLTSFMDGLKVQTSCSRIYRGDHDTWWPNFLVDYKLYI